jgi:hypothetical protein
VKTPGQNLAVDATGARAREKMVGQMVSLFLVFAGEDVQNQVATLRPGVQGNMGLGQQGDDSEPMFICGGGGGRMTRLSGQTII